MIKVLHFFKTYIPDTDGGTESFIFQLAENGKEAGFETEVLHVSPRGSAENEPLANHIVHRARRDTQLFSTDISLQAIIKFKMLAKEADVIHLHYPWPFMDLALLLTQIKKPIVLTYHSDIVKQRFLKHLYAPLMHLTLKRAGVIVATSENYLNSSPVLKKYKHKTQVIPFGLNKENYKTTEERIRYWKDKFGDQFLLFVGKLRYYKGLETLLYAAKNFDYPVVIVGNDGIEKKLHKIKKDENLTNIYFTGALPEEDKVALLQLCYAFVFPSHLRSEAFGISLLEAAMFGKPMITCDIGTGSSFVNIDGETGLYAKPESPEDLSQKIYTLYNNKEISNQMGINAKKRFDDIFQNTVMIKKYNYLYFSVINN